jgi:hypothetical protein
MYLTLSGARAGAYRASFEKQGDVRRRRAGATRELKIISWPPITRRAIAPLKREISIGRSVLFGSDLS